MQAYSDSPAEFRCRDWGCLALSTAHVQTTQANLAAKRR
ncbi:hypothetical protein OOU_Y34scaffold00608g17 [Pyricularia oryzae Y34]|uniref:Uncharacterized protein n=2 Tax=Pyricularia oryzae TaxID=318829 RepID=A0AA97NVL8_PYRO3|nr:hypothetical protein OOU_Y34scaffold00608g17 [Pyricularia oryzae Y34]